MSRVAPSRVLSPNEELRNEARDACIEVLQRHGYDIPGVADLCAGAVLRLATTTPEELTLREAAVVESGVYYDVDTSDYAVRYAQRRLQEAARAYAASVASIPTTQGVE